MTLILIQGTPCQHHFQLPTSNFQPFLLAENSMNASQPAGRSQPAASLLVVDPSPITLLGTAGVLDSFGYTCYCARTSAAALQAAAEHQLDGVVMDVGGDAEAALELVPELRRQAGESALPWIFIADQRWVGLEKRCEQLPAVRCLFKPIDPNVLRDLVDQALWLPQLETNHRRRGGRPLRPGWIELS